MHPAARYFSTWLWTYFNELWLYIIERMLDSIKLIIFSHNYVRTYHTSDCDVTCERTPPCCSAFKVQLWVKLADSCKSGLCNYFTLQHVSVLLVFNSDLHLIVLLRYLLFFSLPARHNPVTRSRRFAVIFVSPKCITLLSFSLVRFIFTVRIWSEHVMSPLPRCSVYSMRPGEDVLVAPQ